MDAQPHLLSSPRRASSHLWVADWKDVLGELEPEAAGRKQFNTYRGNKYVRIFCIASLWCELVQNSYKAREQRKMNLQDRRREYTSLEVLRLGRNSKI